MNFLPRIFSARHASSGCRCATVNECPRPPTSETLKRFFCFVFAMLLLHKNARCPVYPTTDGKKVDRFQVTDDFVPWSVEFFGYNPVFYNAPKHHDECDPDIVTGDPIFKFNQVDGPVNRVSSSGQYAINSAGLPLNPMGRTGVTGRGRLPRWGPVHAADCLVTRWKRSQSNEILLNGISGKAILQFVSICRRDLQVWAIPGGKVNPGEDLHATFVREFCEEALDGFDPASQPDVFNLLKHFFASGSIIYQGYVDDPRNTDNSWMETTVKNFHDETGKITAQFPLKAGDDAGDLMWCDISHDLKLYASHVDFIKKVAELHSAHW